MKKLMQMMLVAVIMTVTIVGCQTATQPGRSQTQTFDDCTFNVFSAPGTGMVATTATDGKKPSKFTVGDILTQNMMVETGGNEANSSEATSTPSTSVPVNVAWGAGAIGGGATAGAGDLDTAYTAFKKWWTEGGGDKTATKTTSTATTTTTSTPTATTAPAAGAACPGGSCELPQ